MNKVCGTLLSMRTLLTILSIFILSACGGGGGGGSGEFPAQAYLLSEPLSQSNGTVNSWDANPQTDLPENGSYGLRVKRPREGGASIPLITFQPDLAYRLEPILLYINNHPDAWARVQDAQLLVWKITNLAYKQWTRHLDYDPGVLSVAVGDGLPDYHSGNVAYYDTLTNRVVLTTAWVIQNYDNLHFGSFEDGVAAVQELFFVLTHEAAHQFGYTNSHGTTDGCGDHGDRCHAPYGSGSVASYDHLQGRSVRYYVTEEDVKHVPNATWNNSTVDRYEISMAGDASSIDSWGVWIDHEFRVSGWTSPGEFSGGNLRIADNIEGTGWISGTASRNVELTGGATWSGQNNFLGVDLSPDYLGALIRADANLRFSFSTNNLNLRINNFEAHYSAGGAPTWHDHSFSDWGNFSYNMNCASDTCIGDHSEANWYASDSGDPTGYVGGVVDDLGNAYVGAFLAEKD